MNIKQTFSKCNPVTYEYLIKMQILGSHPRPSASADLRVEPENLYFKLKFTVKTESFGLPAMPDESRKDTRKEKKKWLRLQLILKVNSFSMQQGLRTRHPAKGTEILRGLRKSPPATSLESGRGGMM